MGQFIPVNSISLNGNEKKYLNECIDTGWLSSEGAFVKKLEKEFAEYSGQKFGSCVANGTVAVELAVRALKDCYDWKNGDEIIIPSFTIISCASGVIFNGLKPVFVDADPLTYNIDTSKIEALITEKTRAIMAVHIYGLSTDLKPIVKLAEKYNLKIIEDAAQAHGQMCYDKMCGGTADISTFSFFANKHIACGEGGFVMTSSSDLDKNVKYCRNLCFSAEKFIHHDLGQNFRMSNIQAAVAYAQFEKLENTIKIKRQQGIKYTENFKNLPVKTPPEKTNCGLNNYWVYGLVLNDEVKFNAREAMKMLADQGIGTRPFFYPLHKQPVLIKMNLTDNVQRPVSEKLYERGFYIPSGTGLSEKQQDTVITQVKNLFE